MIVNGYKIEPNTDLSFANLSHADLSGADLSLADLQGADLQGADLSNADLSNADLQGANLFGASGIVRIGPSKDGYEFFAVKREGVTWIKAGCRWFNYKDAVEHWKITRGGTKIGEERILFCKTLNDIVQSWEDS